MAVSIVESASGTSSTAAGVTVTFADAQTDDLIVFSYGTYFKEFGQGDWLANSGWDQIPSAFFNWNTGFNGMVFHIVGSGETSWNPVNDSSNSVSGIWIAWRVQGHSIANPILNYYILENVMNPNVVPCASGALGMMCTSGFVQSGDSTAISGGVSGGESWSYTLLADSPGNTMVAAFVPAIDNITPSTGTWLGVPDSQRMQQWVIQPAPAAPNDAAEYILKEEVVSSDFSGSTGNELSFNISWTPTVGNTLVFLGLGSSLFPSADPTVTAGWTYPIPTVNGDQYVLATRTVLMGDSTSYMVSTTGGGPADPWYGYVYELTGITYHGAAHGAVTTPNYTTPTEGGTGATLCFYGISVGTNTDPSWAQYEVLSGQTPDGCGAWSKNLPGVGPGKFVSVSSHQITAGGGQGSIGISASTNSGIGLTIVFEIVGSPCILPSTLHFTGDVSGLFYKMNTMGAENVPVQYEDTTVVIDGGVESPTTQTIAGDGQWANWNPNNGPLTIAFPNSLPVRTIWVLTNLSKHSPPSIPVWASSQTFSLWKQTCTVPD